MSIHKFPGYETYVTPNLNNWFEKEFFIPHPLVAMLLTDVVNNLDYQVQFIHKHLHS